MGAHKIEIAPEVVAEGKRLYEQTLTPLRDVSAMMGISRRTLENRIREWNWTRRRTPAHPIDLHHAMRGAIIAAATQEGATGGESLAAVTPQQKFALALRIQEGVEQGLAAVKRVLDKIDPAKPDETERSARALANISHTLRELAAIVQPEPVTPPAHETNNDPVPRDIDEFREALAIRIEAFVAARRAADDGGVLPDAAAKLAARD